MALYTKICCLDLLDAVGFRICCRLYVICCPALKNMLPGFSNVLCTLPIDAFMLCIYLACRLRKRFIVLFRLAIGYWLALSRTAPFQSSLWVSVLPNRAKQLPGPLAIGSCDPLLFGLQAGSQACAGPLGGKRAPRSSL